MGLQSIQVPNSCRKSHKIHIIILIHSPMYMAHNTFRRVINVSSSFPPLHMQIEVWAVSNLTVVLLSFTILNLTTEVQLKVFALYSLRYGTLKREMATPRVLCAGCAKMFLKFYMPFQPLYIT